MGHERGGVVLGAEIFTCTDSDLVWNMYELCKKRHVPEHVQGPTKASTPNPRSKDAPATGGAASERGKTIQVGLQLVGVKLREEK
jgi:hypothetical protein